MPIDTSAADCARMLDGVPQVPQSREEFQNFLQTGAIPLSPSFYIHFVANHPELTDSIFAAGSDFNRLAAHVSGLVSDFDSSAGTLTLLCPQVSPLSKVNVCSFVGRHPKGLKISKFVA